MKTNLECTQHNAPCEPCQQPLRAQIINTAPIKSSYVLDLTLQWNAISGSRYNISVLDNRSLARAKCFHALNKEINHFQFDVFSAFCHNLHASTFPIHPYRYSSGASPQQTLMRATPMQTRDPSNVRIMATAPPPRSHPRAARGKLILFTNEGSFPARTFVSVLGRIQRQMRRDSHESPFVCHH